MSFEEEEEISGYECFFCDKAFDSFERLEEHQEYHLIETECDKMVESDVSDAPVPSSCKTFPEITALLIGSRPSMVNEDIGSTSKQQAMNLEVHSNELSEVKVRCSNSDAVAKNQTEVISISEKLNFATGGLPGRDRLVESEIVSLDQNTSMEDSSSTCLEIKDQNCNSKAINGFHMGQDGSEKMPDFTFGTEKVSVEHKHGEMENQRNVGSRGEGSVLGISVLDVALSKKEGEAIDERVVKEGSDLHAITMKTGFSNKSLSAEKELSSITFLAKKCATSELATQMKNGLNVISDSSNCVTTKAVWDKTESNTTNKSQKQSLQFFCNICRDYFDHVQQHMTIHSWDRPFNCNICGITFKKEVHLKAHQSVHSDERPFACGSCSKRFKRSDTLAIHNRSHTGLKCHTCEICGKSYVSKFVLKRHKVIHSNDRPFACDLCDRKFRIRYDLTVHRRRHFDDKPFSCKECGKKFTNSAHVATHMLIHKNQRSFVCGECGKSFLRKEHLSRHLSNVHVGERNHSCNICNKKFKRPEVLKAHMLTHTRKEEFVCEKCGKSYTTKWNLKAHTERHEIKKKLKGKKKLNV